MKYLYLKYLYDDRIGFFVRAVLLAFIKFFFSFSVYFWEFGYFFVCVCRFVAGPRVLSFSFIITKGTNNFFFVPPK